MRLTGWGQGDTQFYQITGNRHLGLAGFKDWTMRRDVCDGFYCCVCGSHVTLNMVLTHTLKQSIPSGEDVRLIDGLRYLRNSGLLSWSVKDGLTAWPARVDGKSDVRRRGNVDTHPLI